MQFRGVNATGFAWQISEAQGSELSGNLFYADCQEEKLA